MADGNGFSALSEAQQAERAAIAMSAVIDRLQYAQRHGFQYAGKRNVYEALGWKQNLTYGDYEEKYLRQDLAGRIIDLPADATWREGFELHDNEDPDVETPFEKAWKELDRRLRLVAWMQRLDRVAGVGEYAVLFLGMRGQTPETPLGRSRELDLMHVTVFPQPNAVVDRIDGDPGSPRFGLPETYGLQVIERLSSGVDTSPAPTPVRTVSSRSGRSIQAHWSRVIHAAEFVDHTRIYGRPRLQRVFNLLDSLLLIVGATGEAYWRSGRPRLHADIDKEFGGQLSPEQLSDLREQITLMMHGFQDWVRTSGTDITQLAASVSDPRGPVDVILDLASAATGIPKRIMLGSERGELASSQDAMEWAHRISERQRGHAEPVIVRQLVDRLITAGILPTPTEGEYKVTWPDITGPNAVQRAELAERIARAEAAHGNSKLVQGALLTDNEMREVLGYQPSKELDQEIPGGPREGDPEPEPEPEFEVEDEEDLDEEDVEQEDEDEEEELRAAAMRLPTLQRLLSAVSDRAMRNATFDRIYSAAVDMATRTAERFGLKEIDPATRATQDFLNNYGAERVRGINDTTRKQLARTISEGMRANETKKQLATRIRRQFREISRGRALVIAQSETARAANFGTLQGMAQAGVETKRWETMKDGKVRALHQLMQGQTVPVGEPFVSPEGDLAQYPGEFASAAMSANERCWVTPGDVPPDELRANQDPAFPRRRAVHERRVLAGIRKGLQEQRVAVLAALEDETL